MTEKGVRRIWINLGPSLWHFEGNIKGSIDLPMADLKALSRRIGFRLEVSDRKSNRLNTKR